MSERPALRLLNPETGEVTDHCPNCRVKDDEISGLQRDIRGWSVRYRELERDKAREAREHALWPKALELFRLWQKECNHPKSEWTSDRFWLIEPHLSDPKFGEEMCRRAILGAGFDAFTYRRKNGSLKRCDEWQRIFESRGKAEEFVNKAPRS